MTVTITLTDGIVNIPLVYDAGNQHYFQVKYGMKISPGEAVPTWHTSDGFPPELIDLYDPTRTAVLEFNVKPTSTTNPSNTIQNAMALLRRWVDGASQQAARHFIVGDVNRIELKVQRDGSTVATYHPVIYGAVDDSDAHWNAPATINNLAFGAMLYLTLAPAGEAENEISLFNRLLGGAFDFESSTSGLADGWANIATTTNTLSTSIYLLNGMSQKCDASTNGGIQSDTVAATSTSGAGYVWVYVVSGSVDIDLYDSTATAVMDSAVVDATDSGGVSDNNYLDFNGHTWYRVPVSSGGLTNTNNHRIRARASGAAAVWYMDAAYLEFGRTTVPDCWQSYATIYNRGDQSTTNPEYRNWIDVWGIPGDVDAFVRHGLASTITDTTGEYMMLSAFKDKAGQTASEFAHYVEGEDFASGTVVNGAWTEPSVAGTSGGVVKRFTATSTGASGVLTGQMVYSNYPCAVMLRGAASANDLVTVTIALSGSGNSPIISSTPIVLQTDYQDYTIGVLHSTPPVNAAYPTAYYTITATGFTANAQTASIDRVMLVPMIDGRVTVATTGATGTMNYLLVFDGMNEESYSIYKVPELGVYPLAAAGQTVTRFYYNRYDTTTAGTHYLDDTFAITMKILPRTRQLLGTI